MLKEVWLAPMAGITDLPFRKVVCEFGASAVISEMISAEAVTRKNHKTYNTLMRSLNNQRKIIQIVGNDPVTMSESAKINENYGADEININMGCPAKKIINNNSGAALMKDENLAVNIVKSVRSAVKIPVSVKMRLGWDDSSKNALSLAKKLEDVGIVHLAVHGRTRAQEYSGSADWAAIREIKNSLQIPVICNGDIDSFESAKEAIEVSGCNKIMVGRGVLGRPWFIAQLIKYLNNSEFVDDPSISEQLDVVMKHFERTLEFYGSDAGVKIFRKHFCWYSKGMKNSSEFRIKINSLEKPSEIIQTVETFYDSQ